MTRVKALRTFAKRRRPPKPVFSALPFAVKRDSFLNINQLASVCDSRLQLTARDPARHAGARECADARMAVSRASISRFELSWTYGGSLRKRLVTYG